MIQNAASAFDGLKPLFGRALEGALNRLLALDGQTRAAVSELEGHRIRLSMDAPSLALEVSVQSGKLVVGPAEAAEADLAVAGTLAGLLAQLPFLRPGAGVSAGKVKIAGDADLARRLQKLAERFDPDWNLPFTEVFGDIVGVQVASAVRAALRFGREGATRFARHGAEFLTEESRDVVGRAELEAHLDDVDALRDRVERLHARMQLLHRKLGGDASSLIPRAGSDA